MDEEGYLYVMSRVDDVINVAGHRISAGAIEEVLINIALLVSIMFRNRPELLSILRLSDSTGKSLHSSFEAEARLLGYLISLPLLPALYTFIPPFSSG